MKKVSCVMTTYRRFTCVERSIACFLSQNYSNKELIIYNTDDHHPLYLDSSFDNVRDIIKLINNNIDFETKSPYSNVGPIRRDAAKFADGDYYITWDDDDLFFPWNISQCIDGVERTNTQAWKPVKSLIKQRGHVPELYSNYLEASIIVNMKSIQEYGFNMKKTGAEHLGWYEKLTETKQLCIDDNSIPAYCFYWSDEPEVAGHKQSNKLEFERLDNFTRHKMMTKDYAKRALTRKLLTDYKEVLEPFREIFINLKENKNELYQKYIYPNKSLIQL